MEGPQRRRACQVGLCALCAGIFYAATSHGGRRMKSDSFTFRARLLELPSPAPRCGDIKVAVGYRLDILKVVKGTIKTGPVAVLVPCPDLKGENFMTVGASYLIEAAAEIDDARTYTVYNDYPNDRQLWAVDISSA